MNPVHNLKPHFLRIQFKIALPSISRSLSGLLSSDFFTYTLGVFLICSMWATWSNYVISLDFLNCQTGEYLFEIKELAVHLQHLHPRHRGTAITSHKLMRFIFSTVVTNGRSAFANKKGQLLTIVKQRLQEILLLLIFVSTTIGWVILLLLIFILIACTNIDCLHM
jgi:hypothetical protein